MQYRPYWTRIFFLAALLHFILIAVISILTGGIFSAPPEENELEELEWVEVEMDESLAMNDVVQEVPEVEETFSKIELPPIPEPTLTEPKIETPPVETPPQPQQTEKSAESEKKSDADKPADDNLANKLKVLTKVFPKDIFESLIAAGIIKERPFLRSGKVVIAITVDIKGKVASVEIRRGGGKDENGNAVNIISEEAAFGWTFEPYRDAEGNLKEIKTQIEFNPEDF